MKKQCANVTNKGQIPIHIFLIHVLCVFKTQDVTSFVINRDSCNNILPQWSRRCRGAISFRSLVEPSPGLSIFRHTQQSTSRLRLWMCVCARVVALLHEDEMWMIHMKAFLSPVM